VISQNRKAYITEFEIVAKTRHRRRRACPSELVSGQGQELVFWAVLGLQFCGFFWGRCTPWVGHTLVAQLGTFG